MPERQQQCCADPRRGLQHLIWSNGPGRRFPAWYSGSPKVAWFLGRGAARVLKECPTHPMCRLTCARADMEVHLRLMARR
jgi:hypothetical protein